MPKRNEHTTSKTFRLADLEQLRERALRVLAGCEDFRVPQKDTVNLRQQAEMPCLEDLPGIALSNFWADGQLPAEENDLEVLTEVLRRGQKELPNATLYVRCDTGDRNFVGIESNERRNALDVRLQGLLGNLDAWGRELILNRVIQAGQLPVVLTRKPFLGGYRIEAKHTSGASPCLSYADRHGSLSLCGVVDGTCEQQMERVRTVLQELGMQPQEYTWQVLGIGEPADCLRTYETLRGLRFPTTHFGLRLRLAVTELAGLDSMGRLVGLAGRKQFLTTLCRFPLPAGSSAAKKKLGKILVRSSSKGHRVSLFFPSDDGALLASLGGKLGLHFPN